jgi:hypothetical protein
MSRYDRNREFHERKHMFWGIVLIVAGCIFLGDRLDFIEIDAAWHFWPVLIGVFGLVDIACAQKLSHVVKGGFRIALALWLYACLEQLWGWTFRETWPVILIAYGISIALRGLIGASRKSREESLQ